MSQSRDSSQQLDGARNWYAHVMHERDDKDADDHAGYNSFQKSTNQITQEHRKAT